MKTANRRLLSFLSSPKKLFLFISLTAGIISAILVPQLSVSDERMHFLRAYSISQLSFNTKQCSYPSAVVQAAKDSDNKLYNTHYAVQPVDTVDIVLYNCGTAATYNPLLHTPQAIGIAAANLFNAPIGLMILFGRIANVIVYSFLIFFTLRCVTVGRWPIVIVALFPYMIHTAGSLSADAINNAVVISFLAYIISIFFQRIPASRRQLTAIALLSVLLAFTKTSNLPLLGLVLFLPYRIFTASSNHKKKWLFVLPLLTMVSILVAGWSLITSHIPVTSTELENPLSSNPLFFIKILYNTYLSPFVGYSDVVLEGVTDYFSAFQYSLPNSLVVIGWITFAIALLHREEINKHLDSTQVKILSLLAMLCLSIIVTGVTYVLYTAWAVLPERLGPSAIYADGVQGRYFTALLPLLIPPFIWLQRNISVSARQPYVMGSLILITSGGTITFYLYQTYAFAVMSGVIN